MILLEERTVSRKTPLDGKLEISAETARRLGPLGPDMTVAAGGHDGTARLHSMACTCARGAAGSHVHHFLESSLFRSLRPEATARIEMDETSGTVRVTSSREQTS